MPTDVFVHPTAVVDLPCVIGAGTKIWHFTHVMSGARIGRGCTLGQGVFVASTAVVGDGCKVQNHVSLFDGVELEDEVFLGPSCVFTNVKNPRAAVSRRHAFARTRVRRGATIGANATVLCGVTIGRFAMIGAGAVVTRDVAEHAIVVGAPARAVGWASRHGHRLALDDRGRGRCPESGVEYELRDGRLHEIGEGAP
ncbi:MAG: N-acetyltransferase [Deltaproteobacteria bacterium]|nr:N-acetyltransferase [Deltaproteobacteria bacterium]